MPPADAVGADVKGVSRKTQQTKTCSIVKLVCVHTLCFINEPYKHTVPYLQGAYPEHVEVMVSQRSHLLVLTA